MRRNPTPALCTLALCTLAVATLLFALPAAADTVRGDTLNPDADGWAPVAEGVWQRVGTDGRVTTRVQGLDGLEWALPSLRQELEVLTRDFLANPDDASLRDALDRHLAVIEDIERRVVTGTQADAPADAVASCTRTFSVTADAFPEGCGAGAHAAASYSTNCPEACDVYARAFARRTCGNQTYTESNTCTDNGTNVSCSASASRTGAFNSCFSDAYAYVYCPDLNNLLIDEYDSNSSCMDGSQLCALCRIPIDDKVE